MTLTEKYIKNIRMAVRETDQYWSALDIEGVKTACKIAAAESKLKCAQDLREVFQHTLKTEVEPIPIWVENMLIDKENIAKAELEQLRKENNI